ncbi:unnamed protein product [Rangifer tarandus platyrhynchus]|uniref:Uncharacterized protein n=1 Tax=Rangifer tarandus platyrhynchus TaxID=3082113 RepID=A0AC59ZB48_RANTA
MASGQEWRFLSCQPGPPPRGSPGHVASRVGLMIALTAWTELCPQSCRRGVAVARPPPAAGGAVSPTVGKAPVVPSMFPARSRSYPDAH